MLLLYTYAASRGQIAEPSQSDCVFKLNTVIYHSLTGKFNGFRYVVALLTLDHTGAISLNPANAVRVFVDPSDDDITNQSDTVERTRSMHGI